jgi:hypothetical protein
MYFKLHLNATRGGIKAIPDATQQLEEVRKHLKLALVPKNCGQGVAD